MTSRGRCSLRRFVVVEAELLTSVLLLLVRLRPRWLCLSAESSRMCAVQLLRVSVRERITAAAEDVLLRLEAGEEAALRALLTERLTAAAEEIVGLLEETVAEYEDRVERSEREICRQRRLLDAVLKPQVRLHRTVLPSHFQRVVVVKEEQQQRSSSLDQDQEEPEPPHIKEEQEEPRTSQQGEQLQGLEEADITKFTFTPVPVKSEEDEEKSQSSQLHQTQTGQMETEAGGSEPDRNSDPDHKTGASPEPDTDDSADWKETREPQSASNSVRTDEVPVSDLRFSTCEKLFGCSECGKRFPRKETLQYHMSTHTGEKPFVCSVCKQSFARKPSLRKHLKTHQAEKRFSCSVCNSKFFWCHQLKIHQIDCCLSSSFSSN
ncbi:zinc finger and SCAN domain-containing protein 5C-like [Centropristis striata]|uniref:zinc finger and SCAN domain-containing protein 5C-like n=1 Tax=Centropristis striata TaxID=184440 RepID=UPI0027DFA16B|nr:zinc finger and SCAN domain-containing protein 5C-like [Centropristis striata]